MGYINIKKLLCNAKKVNILISNECNLKCLACFNSNRNANSEVINLEDINKIIKFFNKQEFIISGGEPFLHEQILDIVKLFSNNTTTIITNGSIIREEVLLEMKKYNVNLQISLHSFSEKTEKNMRGVSLESIKKNIEILKKYLSIKNISINYMANKYSIEELEALLSYCQTKGIERILITPIVYMGNAVENWDEIGLDVNEKIILYNKIAELKQVYKNLTIIPSGFKPYLNIKDNKEMVCEQIIEEVVINEKGEIAICKDLDGYLLNKGISMHYESLIYVDKLQIQEIFKCRYSENYLYCYVENEFESKFNTKVGT